MNTQPWNNAQIKIETSYVEGRDGDYLKFTPVVTCRPLFSEEIRLACYTTPSYSSPDFSEADARHQLRAAKWSALKTWQAIQGMNPRIATHSA